MQSPVARETDHVADHLPVGEDAEVVRRRLASSRADVLELAEERVVLRVPERIPPFSDPAWNSSPIPASADRHSFLNLPGRVHTNPEDQ